MFDLGESELSGSILGVGDGPASFNMELAAQGYSVVSVDPIYQFTREEIARRVQEIAPVIAEQLTKHSANYVWREFSDVEHLVRSRLDAMDKFLGDFDDGKRSGRYVASALPQLPFLENSFDLAVCSHFLFLYDDMLDVPFHLSSVTTLCRVAKEVRIFPVMDQKGAESKALRPVLDALASTGYDWELRKVSYCFQSGADCMLVIYRR